MGKLRKEGSKWVVDFRIPRRLALKYGIKRFRRAYSKKAIASRVHGLISAAIALNDPEGILGSLLGQVEQGYTIKSFYDRWIVEYKPRLTDSTLTRYKLSFVTINHLQGHIQLKDYTRATLYGYVQWRCSQVSKSTVNKDTIAIKSMFSYALDVGAIGTNPLVRFPALKTQEKARRIPTAEEFTTLVKAETDKDVAIGAMIAVMGETGIRRSEAINLEWKNVDLRNGSITLENTKGKRVRRIPMSESAAKVFHGLKRFVHTHAVFAHQITGDPWKSPDKTFRANRPAGLKWITFHTLRHMRCTRWLEEGYHPVQVQKWMGHRDIQTTMRYEHYKQEIPKVQTND